MTWSTLSTRDHPLDAFQVKAGKCTQKWLSADEPDCGRDLSEIISPRREAIKLNGNPGPDVGRPRQRGRQACQAYGSLGQYLENMPVRSRHDIKNAAYEFVGDLMVKQIGHGIDKDSTGFSPPQR
jgi:hypothetical protein